MTYEEQLVELDKLPPAWAIKTKPGVKGPFTSGDFVRYWLNHIFGPDNWTHTVRSFEVVRLNPDSAYAEALIRLKVRFANGHIVAHDDLGVVPLYSTKEAAEQGGAKVPVGLDNTDPAVHETAKKAAITDGIKACSENLGLCFRPLTDDALKNVMYQRDALRLERAKKESPVPEPGPAESVTPPSMPEPASTLEQLAAERGIPSRQSAPAAPAPTLPPAPVTTPPTDEFPSPKKPTRAPVNTQGNGTRKRANINQVIRDFDTMCQRLANADPLYRKADGSPKRDDIQAACHRVGYPVLTKDNLREVELALLDDARATRELRA